MPASLSAHVFALLAGVTTAFQLALVAGAPWGALTQGGRYPGVLPWGARAVAVLSAILLPAFIGIVRAHADARPRARAMRFPRLIWAVVAYCALGIAAHIATPSALERALWLPVVTLMFLTSLHVGRTRRGSPSRS